MIQSLVMEPETVTHSFDLHVEDGDEGDLSDVQIPYACFKSSSQNSKATSCAEFEVILDEAVKTSTKPNLSSNFFYDEKLLTLLSGGVPVSSQIDRNNNDEDLPSSDDELEPFAKMARNMECLTGDGGIMKKIIKPGVGSTLTNGTSITYNYNCYLEYGDEPMDSTYLRNEPAKTRIGECDVLPGLAIALASMRLKEEAHFLLQPSYAFGKLGCPPRIPAAARLLFEVHLISALDCAAADEVEEGEWGWERHNKATFEERLAAARAYHRKGNSYYSSSNLHHARRCYQRAAWLMEHAPLQDETEETICYTLQTKLFANLAKVYLDKQEPTRVCTQCRMALELPFDMPTSLKAKIFFRYGKAKALLNSFDDARKYFLRTQKLKPNCPGVAKELEQLTLNQKKYRVQEKFMYKKMFGHPCDGGYATKEDPKVKKGMAACLSDKQEDSTALHACNSGIADSITSECDSRGALPKACSLITKCDMCATLDRSVVMPNLKCNGRKFEDLHPTNLFEEKLEISKGDHWIEGDSGLADINFEPNFHDLGRNLKPEFLDTVEWELHKLINSDSKVKEVLFPSSLSVDELAYLTSIASEYGCELEFSHKGNIRYPKVVCSGKLQTCL